MKLTAIILLTVCMAASATGNTQSVSISVKNASLVKVFQELEKQTGYTFLYENKLLEKANKVTISLKNASLEQVLDQCFKAQPLTFKIFNKTVVIKEKEATKPNGEANLRSEPPPPIDVKGRIVDENGKPVIASVQVKGTGKGTTTNDNGEFELQNVDDNATLVISGVSIETFEVKVNGRSELALNASIKVSPLEETIVRGYYTQKRITQVGDVTKVKGSDIEKQPIGDPVLALQGRVAGLQMSLSSGIPGAKVNIQLRGKNSLRFGANDPLFIIDGIPFPSSTLTNSSSLRGPGDLSPFSSINMQDIESIEVLKDADATAIYGSRGANGVILITTKKGKAGKTKVTANLSTGFGKVSKMLDLLNTQEYLQIRHEALQNDGIATIPSNNYDINGIWDTTRYTDWQKVFIGNTSHITNTQVSVSGGDDLTQYLIGGSYRKETTIFPGDYNDKKISAFLNITSRSENRKFTTQLSASYLNDNNLLPTEDFTKYIFLAPDAPSIYNTDGSLNWSNDTWSNPLALIQRKSKSITTNLIGNLNLSYNILLGLDIKVALGYNKIHMDQTLTFPLSSYSPSAYFALFLRKNQFGNNDIATWNAEPQITYNRQVGNGKLEALVGCTFQQTINNFISQSASSFLSDALIENIAAATNISTSNSGYSQYRYNALFGRLGYNWKERYLINLTTRRDGSTRFGPKKQFGNFGAVGMGWIFSNEEFIKNNLKFLSYGKLRASYGTTGNDQLPPYQYLRTYSVYSASYLGSTGLTPTRLTNPYFEWEMVKKLEFGLELGFIKDRILVYANYYRNRTDNQLVGYSLPAITGFTTVQANLPAVIQNKGVEFELNTVNIRNGGFSWETAFNISFPRNNLVEFPNIAASSYATTYEVGKSLFASKKYVYTGVNPQTGMISYQDINGDGSITSAFDRASTKENTQKYFGGLNNSFSFKGISLDVFFQFVKQTGFIYLWNGTPGIALTNQPTTVLDRWRKPGDITNVQKLTQDYSSNYYTAISNFNSSDGQVGDASFIRLKNVSLSYVLPHRWTQTLRLSQTKIYLSAQNMFTITKYKGLDPEVQSITNVAPVRIIEGGIQVSF